MNYEARHRRLLGRLGMVVLLTLAIDLTAAVLMFFLERDAQRSQIHTYWDAFFFTTVQLLTISSQLRNPVTSAGKVLDVALEAWAIFVVTAVAGSFASFFQTGDAS